MNPEKTIILVERKGIGNRLQVFYCGGEGKKQFLWEPSNIILKKKINVSRVFMWCERSLQSFSGNANLSVWQWNYCMFIRNFNNGHVYFSQTVCACIDGDCIWISGHITVLKAAAQSPVWAATPPTGTALLQFPQQQVFHNMSSGVLKLFLILIFIWVAYNQARVRELALAMTHRQTLILAFSVNLNK